MYWVLGLGNPGSEYARTRHNAGFQAVDLLASKYGIPVDRQGCHAMGGVGKIKGEEILIAKPMTYMNESGKSARALMKAEDLDPGQLIVLHDEIDLPVGKIKRKFGGGHAGQKGVRSIIERLETDKFYRVRIGVGRPNNRADLVDHVLSEFNEDEQAQFNLTLDLAVERVEEILTELRSRQ
ncbi:MAG: aminoacyl-tRNA hydrolase [Candidatus Nitronauta litoralis]|uniref:Peptidyl-tRNA hydrolase n=1 Tax=Candidatus Nitronauta litoralis TaxID=2705533 RepID=A0A7T0BV18_9BACT|nr:MAG: aminoacyl-tRNA hydrolase [Candidatus Nitronauta litoralis]